jgi:hypothetical protein
VGAALAVLAAGQALAALRLPVPLDGVALQVTKENYGFLTEGREMTVSFQLRNDGERPVRISGFGQDLPGLDKADEVAAGEPFGFRSRGAGAEPLPAFDLAPGTVVVLALTYRLASCRQVPDDMRPVPVRVQDGRAKGTRAVPLPQLPDDGPEATADDVVEWQQVLARELCA